MIQINPLKSYIDGGVRAALTTPPSASLVFDLPGKAIWVKGVKLKGTDHTYIFNHDNYITLTNTPDKNNPESEDIKIGVNITTLKNVIDTTYNGGTLALLQEGLNTEERTWLAKILHNYINNVLPITKNLKINGTNYAIYTTENSLPLFFAPVSLGATGQILACTSSGLIWVDLIQNTDYRVSLSSTTSNSDYRIILKQGANNNPETDFVRFSEYLTFNPYTKTLKINNIKVVTATDIYTGSNAGLVPTATSAQLNYYLRGDGAWVNIATEMAAANTWRPIKVGNTDALGSGTNTGTLSFIAGTGIALSWDATNKRIIITNSSPDVNHNTDETVRQVPKTDNVNRPLMMINGSTSAGEQINTSMFSTGIYANASTKMITANGFIKAGSSDDYVLLGGGNHKALSDFSMAGHTHIDTFLVTNDSNYVGLSFRDAALSKLANKKYIECWDSTGGWWNWVAGKWIKAGSNDSYVLLGGGGHKLISDFASSSHSHNYAANESYGGFTKSGRLPISGFYQSNESESEGNAPWTSWMHLINCLHSNTSNNYALLIAASFFDNNIFKIRVTENNVNNTWRDIIHSGNIGSLSVNYANSAGSVAWNNITNKPINFKAYSGSLANGGWKIMQGNNSSPSIAIAYNNGAASWNSGTYSATLVYGCSDTRGLLDCSHYTPVVTFGGCYYGGANDNNPTWYFKLLGTTGIEYNLDTRWALTEHNHDSKYLRKDTNDSTPYQYTFTKTNDHAIRVGTVRGTAVGSQTGEYIHLYERVAIGSPSGWGSRPAPSYGLATYGGAWLATDTGSVGIGTNSPLYKLDVAGKSNIDRVLSLNKNRMLLNLGSFIKLGDSTGTIAIKLPLTIPEYDMPIIKILVYEYNSQGASEIVIGGHNWRSNDTSGNWYNHSYYVNGNYSRGVRLAENGSYWYILLGTTTTTWNYVGVYVSEVYTQYDSFRDKWTARDCEIIQVTSESSFKNIITPRDANLYWANIKVSPTSSTGTYPTFGSLSVVNDSCNNSIDALAYFQHRSNNDWTVKIDSGSYDYGLLINASGTYALYVGPGASRFKGSVIVGADATPSYTLDVRGTTRSTNRIYANEWIQFDNYTGLYSPNNGAHFYPNNTTSFGQWQLRGSRNGYSGIHFGDSTYYMTIMDSGTHKGIYSEGWGDWILYFNLDSKRLGLRTSSLTSYAVTCNGDFYCRSGWLRTEGATGLYNESYGGGWYMTDSTYIRVYGSKRVYNDNTSQYAFYTSGGMTALGHIWSSSSSQSWLDGQRAETAALNIAASSNTGAYWPWFRQTLTAASKWISVGTLNNSLYFIGSATSRTENSYDYGFIMDFSNGTFSSSGSVYATHFYENSDIRYKKILNNLLINSNTIATLPLFDFKWIENNTIGTGTSALAVLLILPNIVSGTDKLTLDYGVLGTIAGITACKELVTLKSELLQLKEKVKLLEDKLSKYENTL